MKQLRAIIYEIYPHLQLKLLFTTGYTTGSYFRQKSLVPTSMSRNVVYIYRCNQCNATCIGETSGHLYSRYCERLGVSPRTLKPVSNPLKSSIGDHSETKNHSISVSILKVLHICKSQDLKLSESILIHKLCPNLNAQGSSTPLKILCYLYNYVENFFIAV